VRTSTGRLVHVGIMLPNWATGGRPLGVAVVGVARVSGVSLARMVPNWGSLGSAGVQWGHWVCVPGGL